MKGLKRENNLHLRISKQEKQKYNAIANDIGLTLSAFARYSMQEQVEYLIRLKRNSNGKDSY
jgi:hypothetical protein